ncbi:CBS domain-containing protein [Streptomyces nanshensis]|uniref:Inosine-5'-monophosphate dehydrogenase n=1 Tax=Streptomyces nanshensis TaxID=518642 RepID=A0A1E7L9V1_9ACTN|nr:CBS domain-containing protein [Streptomyces nanshensis]OEV12934.1 inosine-5'-monophosphate dehydrogenase [Streptomyces nanshensis]
MEHRTVNDLMTRAVVRVRDDATFKKIARVMADNDVTALPVVDEDEHPVGVVSEADLVGKQAGQPDPAGLLPAHEPRAGSRTPGEAATADELMTSPAVVARPEWNVVEAARVMADGHVKRLPVVNEAGRLVGILSRADLLRVFLRRDSAIQEEITRDVLERTLGLAARQLNVQVRDGCVTLRGEVEQPHLVPVVERLVQSVDGVVKVRSHLDTTPRAA